jgi:membrane dipeptidase
LIRIDAEEAAFHRSCAVVDLHADTPALLVAGYDLGKRHKNPLPRSPGGMHLDLPRMREGGVSAQFFGLVSFSKKLPLCTRGPSNTINHLLNMLERAERKYPDQFVLVRTAAGVRAANETGRVAGLGGIEGAHALEGNLDLVAHFARRGVAYLGLLHFVSNPAGAPALGKGQDDSMGLTPWGHALVEELNKHKIIVDLAHINRRGFMDAAFHSKAPVLVSHTGVAGVFPHWRNIDDDQIRAVARSGGCIGVIFSRGYLGGSHLQVVCDHLEHLIRVGGEDIPALGSDYDGLVTPPRGLEDISKLPHLTAALLRRGLPRVQVSKIMGKNALRVLAEVAGQ